MFRLEALLQLLQSRLRAAKAARPLCSLPLLKSVYGERRRGPIYSWDLNLCAPSKRWLDTSTPQDAQRVPFPGETPHPSLPERAGGRKRATKTDESCSKADLSQNGPVVFTWAAFTVVHFMHALRIRPLVATPPEQASHRQSCSPALLLSSFEIGLWRTAARAIYSWDLNLCAPSKRWLDTSTPQDAQRVPFPGETPHPSPCVWLVGLLSPPSIWSRQPFRRA